MKTRWAFAIPLVVTGLTSGLLRAETTDAQKPFSMLCVAEQGTGFNWKNDDWVQTSYKLETYIINKLDGQDRMCWFVGGERGEFSRPVVRDDLGKGGYSKGCYLLKEIGKKSGTLVADRCQESWIDKNGELVLGTIFCEGTFFDYKAQIDGAFILTRTYGVLMRGKQKDSVTLQIGKCSLLNNP